MKIMFFSVLKNLFVFAVFLMLMAEVFATEKYTYQQVSYGSYDDKQVKFFDVTLIIDPDRKLISQGDSVVAYWDCSGDHKLWSICLHSPLITIAIPISLGEKNKKEWILESHEGLTYKFVNEGESQLEILGEKQEIIVITRRLADAKLSRNHHAYYYSKKNGIVGFTLYYADEGISETYFSVNKYGYGVQESKGR